MNAQQLRNSILQEAIEGRLVPQDPNDEPASVLLNRIREEKKRLVKEGKLKKKDLEEIPISEDEKPFEIPESWEWCSLGSVISLLSGRDLTPQDYNDNNDGIPYITGASNFEGGSLVINRWTPKPVSISKYGDLLITCKGTIGTMAFNTVGDIHIARQVMAISPYIIDLNFIKFYLMRIVSELDKKAKSIIPGISREDIVTASFPLPPLAEQKRIVAKIEELLPKVEEYGKAQEALNKLNEELPEKLKKSILQEAIEGRLVPQDPNDEPASVLLDKIRAEKKRLVKEGKLKKKDLEETPISEDEKPFEIPESWVWVRFGTITINRDSERVPLSVDERRQLKKTYDYYGASGVIDKVDRYLFDKPLLLIGEDGANLINRSTPIAFIAKGKYWVNNHAHVLDYYNEDLMQYVCWYINAISLVDYVTGTAQPKMNQEKMNSIMVALPPLAEQKRIVAKIEEVFKEIDKLKK